MPISTGSTTGSSASSGGGSKGGGSKNSGGGGPVGYNAKNDPAGPRKTSAGLNASSATGKASAGGKSSGSVGGPAVGYNAKNDPMGPRRTNVNYNTATPQGTGLTTNATMPGNTAYGPAGGTATGYATASGRQTNDGSGLGPGTTNYSNYRNPDGSPAYAYGPGAPGGVGVRAPNAGVGAQRAAYYNQVYAPRPAGGVPPNAVARPGGVPPNQPGLLDPPDYSAYGPRINRDGYWSGVARDVDNTFRDTLHGVGPYGNPTLGTPGPTIGGYYGSGSSQHYKSVGPYGAPPSTNYRGGTGRTGGGYGGGRGGGW